jgi:Sulfotransferase family
MDGGLGAGDIVEDAIAATGIRDVGDDWFMTPLAAWASDLEQSNLTDRGRRFFRSLAVRDVSRRLRVLDTLREHPEIDDVEIPPIVYITGLERSGTTVLHNLVALHRSSRALLRWELMEPVPPPTTATYETDPRIAAVQASVEPLRGSLLEQMHWVNADEPEECVWGFIDCVSMLGQAPSFCMPSWRRFISEADQTPAFEHYRQVVQLLTWQHPVDPGGFLVLKAPQIALHLDSFADVFSEARFVVTDRDPYRALVSVRVLGQSIVEPFCVVNPVTHPGPHDVDQAVSVENKLAAIQAFTDARPERIVHLGYPDLVDEPSSTVTGLLDTIGVPVDPELADRIDAFLTAQRAGRRSAPPASLDTFGYDHADVLARPVIARYCARFGVDPERSRLTGAS